MLAFKSQMNKASCLRFLALDNHYYSTTAMIFTTASCSPEIVMKNVAAEMSTGEGATPIKRCL